MCVRSAQEGTLIVMHDFILSFLSVYIIKLIPYSVLANYKTSCGQFGQMWSYDHVHTLLFQRAYVQL